ncbi:MAG: HPr(Ser) kinase/phosphatase [Oscillospiraceae bacterium]|jgi:HPr kinase/phosphorylase|nr:HPr(Ser) kinase/phosphatase [Oscillospiraceae bacterium]
MATLFTVSLENIIQEFKLEEIYSPKSPKEIMISSSDVNRPGLQLTGFYDYFDRDRIQIIGAAETAYLEWCGDEECEDKLDEFFGYKPAAVIVARSLDISEITVKCAKRYSVPLLRTDETTSTFLSALTAKLNVDLAPRITRHGVLIEVYGEGVLILGDSGIGKSETAVELIKRGHRLIADDAVELRRVSSKTIVGASPANIRHFIELRGIGIVNARRLFGISSVKLTETVNLVINMEVWDKQKEYDRLGMENKYTSILGIKIPSITIPVNPGRNLAVIIEVAAMNARQRKMGYNSAKELFEKMGIIEPPKDEIVEDIF